MSIHESVYLTLLPFPHIHYFFFSFFLLQVCSIFMYTYPCPSICASIHPPHPFLFSLPLSLFLLLSLADRSMFHYFFLIFLLHVLYLSFSSLPFHLLFLLYPCCCLASSLPSSITCVFFFSLASESLYIFFYFNGQFIKASLRPPFPYWAFFSF